MSEKITGFAVFKNTDKKSEKQPDYKASVKIGDKYYELGAGWIKDGKNGKFQAFTLSEPREYEFEGKTVKRPGFKIVPVADEKENTTSPDENGDVINVDDIPF